MWGNFRGKLIRDVLQGKAKLFLNDETWTHYDAELGVLSWLSSLLPNVNVEEVWTNGLEANFLQSTNYSGLNSVHRTFWGQMTEQPKQSRAGLSQFVGGYWAFSTLFWAFSG